MHRVRGTQTITMNRQLSSQIILEEQVGLVELLKPDP
jgi:hypothetical protein